MALSMKVKFNEPIRIGDAVIAVSPHTGSSFKIIIDAPYETRIFRLGKFIFGNGNKKTTRAITPTNKEK